MSSKNDRDNPEPNAEDWDEPPAMENTFGRAALLMLMLPNEHQQHYDCVCAHDDRMRQDKHRDDFETTAHSLSTAVQCLSRRLKHRRGLQPTGL